MNNFKHIAGLLAQRAEEVARHLFSNGKKEGNEYCIGNMNDEPGKSLKIHLSGNKAGIWSDFATGEGGDLVTLWAIRRQIRPVEALHEASEYLGLGAPKFEGHRPHKFVRPSVKIDPVVQQSPVMDYLLNERKLTIDTIKAFQVGEKGMSYVFPYLRDGELIFAKYIGLDRPRGKKKIHVTKDCEPCLFGWHVLSDNVRSVTLTEGELDTMSLYQYSIASLSVPYGGGNGGKHNWIEYEFERLAPFDEIYLCFDPDSAGKKAITELVKRLGRHRCRIVTLPYKDPNECLQRGVSTETIKKCFSEARSVDPEELKPASSFVNQVIDEFYPAEGQLPGYALPWQYVKDKIRFRPAELSIWTGINGHGKSQILGHVLLHQMSQGARVCIASLEIKPQKLLMRLTRQAAALDMPTQGYIQAIHGWYGNRLWLFDLLGTAKADRLMEVFLYARQRYGIDVFVIDSFMKCGIDEEDFRSQKAFIERLCDFKNEHDCHVHIVVHPRKSSDETQVPGKMDCKGTGAITDLADNCYTVWRNKAKEAVCQLQESKLPLSLDQSAKLEQCDAILRCDKNRNGDWEGKVALWFERRSLQYLGKAGLRPTQYVQYSATDEG